MHLNTKNVTETDEIIKEMGKIIRKYFTSLLYYIIFQ